MSGARRSAPAPTPEAAALLAGVRQALLGDAVARRSHRDVARAADVPVGEASHGRPTHLHGRLGAPPAAEVGTPEAVSFRAPDAFEAALTAADPNRLADLARRHQCEALLYAVLAGEAQRLPAGVRDGLTLAFHRNGLRNRWLAERLGSLLAELASAGVSAMPLKGVTLAFGSYPAAELRPIGDLDLLIREDDFPPVAAALRRLGYAGRLPPLAPRELPRYAQTVEQVRFAGREPPIELHFRLLHDGLPAAREEAWEDAVPLTLPGIAGPLAVPSPERTLLHLALHVRQHGFALLRLFADLAVLVRRAPLDPDRLAALGRRHRLTTAVWLAWHWADLLLACGPPPAAVTPPSWRRRLAEATWRRDRVLALAADRPPREAELPLAHLLGGATPAAKLAFATAVAWPPRRWLPPGGRRRHLARLAGGVARLLRSDPDSSDGSERRLRNPWPKGGPMSSILERTAR